MTSNELFKMTTKENNDEVKIVNGYHLCNPYERSREAKKGCINVIHCDTPYGFYFDLPVNSLMNGLNTKTARMFKEIGEKLTNHMAQKTGENVITKYFAYVHKESYVRFELTTSYYPLTDAMEAHLPLLNLEYNIAKKEISLGRKLTKDEVVEMYEDAEKETSELMDKIA